MTIGPAWKAMIVEWAAQQDQSAWRPVSPDGCQPTLEEFRLMLLGTCHCGDVQIEMRRTPRTLTECNCSICRRYAARWAYGSRQTVRVTHRPGAVQTYEYDNKTFRYVRCARCGCVTHYERFNTANNDRIAVNARMLDPDAIASIPIRTLDVRAKQRR